MKLGHTACSKADMHAKLRQCITSAGALDTYSSEQALECIVHAGCRWYYAKEMQTDEMVLFVGYDSRDDGRARFTPHSSFQDPTTPADAPYRESVELRAYVFWEDDSFNISSTHV